MLCAFQGFAMSLDSKKTGREVRLISEQFLSNYHIPMAAKTHYKTK
jgi:hypothetical protein